PLCFEFAAVRVWAVRHGAAGPPIWLLVRRSLEATPEIKYYVSNGAAATPLGGLAQVACTRHAVEEDFEAAKSYLGMAQYETRSWIGWHHHMSLVAMAHLFITLTRRDLKKNAGADAGPDGAVAPACDGDPWALAGGVGVAGRLPHQSQRDRPAVAHQDLDGQARGDQDPPAVGRIEAWDSLTARRKSTAGRGGSVGRSGQTIGPCHYPLDKQSQFHVIINK